MQTKDAPVLLVTFNRPDTARVVFEAIKKAKPKKLYISSDGPREKNYEADWKAISECRQLVNEVDWECKVETRFLTENMGVGAGPSSAVTWAFEKEDRLIILEDDCVPSLSFFSFCNELLEKYIDDHRIMNIAGTRWNEEFPIKNCDYFFTRYAHIWGWATWKRAWNLYDFWMKDWPVFKEKKILNMAFCDNPAFVKRWHFLFNNIYNLQKKHAWDYQWQYAILKNNGLCINAVKNLVTNIGVSGFHYEGETDAHNRTRYEIKDELRAPAFLYPEYGFDTYHGRNFFLKDRSNLKLLYDNIESKIPFLNK